MKALALFLVCLVLGLGCASTSGGRGDPGGGIQIKDHEMMYVVGDCLMVYWFSVNSTNPPPK